MHRQQESRRAATSLLEWWLQAYHTRYHTPLFNQDEELKLEASLESVATALRVLGIEPYDHLPPEDRPFVERVVVV